MEEERNVAYILDPAELARTLTRDLGREQAIRYARMIGMDAGGTDLNIAYREAGRLMSECAQCPECGVYPAGTHGGICEGCHAYREHTETF